MEEKNLAESYQRLKEQNRKLTAYYEQLQRECADYKLKYEQVAHSKWWKLTKPCRFVFDKLKRIIKLLPYTKKAIKLLFTQGPRVMFAQITSKVQGRLFGKEQLRGRFPFEISRAERKRQEEFVFDKNVKFSVIVPLFNTPEQYLREMIDSVLEQTYKNLELCLADGSDEEHGFVAEIVKEYSEKDNRIVYKKLKENKGISGNTNECLNLASGDYITLFDHDDLLHPSALFYTAEAVNGGADFVYTDEATFDNDDVTSLVSANLKPDFAIDTLRSYNYICHLTSFKRDLLDAVGMFRSECDGSQDYDLILRLTEKAEKISHVQKVLYFWRAHKASTASDISAKPYIMDSAKRALSDHLERVGIKGTVENAAIPSTYRINYEIIGNPKISIVIANKDEYETLKKCIDSILNLATYDNYEIVIVENNSTEQQIFDYYDQLAKENKNIRVIKFEGKFNYSAVNNLGVNNAEGDYILLLNNDTEVISTDFLQNMLMYAQRSDVGAVGAMLYYPDNTIQHAGVVIGIGGVAGHVHNGFNRGAYGYMSRAAIAQNYSAVTAACVMVSKSKFLEVGGLDEGYAVAFNDIDFCMQLRKAGYLNVFTPYAELYHYESKSRGMENTPEKVERFNGEIRRFQSRWTKELIDGDIYYNPNLSLESDAFALKTPYEKLNLII